jgi:hypothetical protein
MAHFAKIDNNNRVVNIHVVDNAYVLDENGQESEEVGIEFLRKVHNNNDNYVQTSYNGNIRVRYAAIGYTYDETLDAFIPPKPYPSWVLNETTADWEAPVEKPDDGQEYTWNEETRSWDLISAE